MSYQNIANAAPQNASQIFELTGDERVAYMKALGARNVDPPLPRSSHLRNKKTGVVFPWNELLAEQYDVMECCDASGNTDPAAWQATVAMAPLPDEDNALMAAKALDTTLGVATGLTDTYRSAEAPVVAPVETRLPDGTEFYDDVNPVPAATEQAPIEQEGMPEGVVPYVDLNASMDDLLKKLEK